LLFPTGYSHSRVRVKKELRKLYFLLKECNGIIDISATCQELLPKLKAMIHRTEVGTDEFLVVIGNTYRIFSKLVNIKEMKNRELKVNRLRIGQNLIPFTNFQHKENNLQICKDLQKYVKIYMGKYLLGFYIHGSISTLDYTDFSDLDTVLVLKGETIVDPQKFKDFIFHNIGSLCYLHRFQNLHHHGNTILTEQDLDCYNQAVLPCEVFKYSKALFGTRLLTFKCRDSTGEHLEVIYALLNSLNCYLVNPDLYLRNVWHFRYFIGTILILPVLYLETLGIYVYKKFSFEKTRRYFSGNWGAVKIAEEMRRRWIYFPSALEKSLAYFFLKVRKNPLVSAFLMAKMSQSLPPRLKELLYPDFAEKCISFSDELMLKIGQMKTESI